MHIPSAVRLAALSLPFAFPAIASGQESGAIERPVVACPTQDELEQVVGSDGQIRPDGCTTLQVNALSTERGDICLIDFGLDEGFLGRIRDAAFPTQWWVKCEDLAANVRP